MGVLGMVSATGDKSYYGTRGIVNGGSGTNYGVYGQALGGALNYGIYSHGRLRVHTSPGDSAAMLPDDAISAGEILDEPGITSKATGDYTIVTVYPTTPVAVDSITITTPTVTGYVVLEAGGVIQMGHTTGTSSSSAMTISDTWGDYSSGSAAEGRQRRYIASAVGSGDDFSNFYCSRVVLASGPSKYYLNAYVFTGTGAFIRYKWIRATYYPTSYGSVTVMAPTLEPSASINISGSPQQLEARVEIDLRDMEIRALRARAAAEEAERELQEAQRAKMEEKRAEKIE